MSLLLSILVGQAVVGGPAQSAPTGQIDVAYNPRREIKFTGVVTGKTKGTSPGRSQGLSILVRSGKTIREVEVGPSWFVGRQEAAVNMNDKVTITGMPVVLDRREHVVIARQIMRGNKVLALRDGAGNPFWTVRRPKRSKSMSDGADTANVGTAYTGTVGQMKMMNVNGVEFAGYTVQTPNGPMDVAVAPSWYWNNQASTFEVGQNVTFYGNGAGGGIGGHNGIILANSATYDGGSIVLNSYGSPVYGGFRTIRP